MQIVWLDKRNVHLKRKACGSGAQGSWQARVRACVCAKEQKIRYGEQVVKEVVK